MSSLDLPNGGDPVLPRTVTKSGRSSSSGKGDFDIYHLTTLTEEALAQTAKSAQGTDFVYYRNALWEKIKDRVKTVQHKYASLVKQAGIDVADLESESLFVLDVAIRYFDYSKGRSFWPYYHTCLLNRFKKLAMAHRIVEEELHEDLVSRQETKQFDEMFAIREWIEAVFPPNVEDRDMKLLVFQLHTFQEWTMDRLAKRFDLSVGTIHAWITFVKKRLREAWQRSNEGGTHI
jgi:RNA polymerase sigma factor (sigma-70 family)